MSTTVMTGQFTEFQTSNESVAVLGPFAKLRGWIDRATSRLQGKLDHQHVSNRFCVQNPDQTICDMGRILFELGWLSHLDVGQDAKTGLGTLTFELMPDWSSAPPSAHEWLEQVGRTNGCGPTG